MTNTLTLNGGFIHGYGANIYEGVALNLNAETIIAVNQSTSIGIRGNITGSYGITKICKGTGDVFSALRLMGAAKTFTGIDFIFQHWGYSWPTAWKCQQQDYS